VGFTAERYIVIVHKMGLSSSYRGLYDSSTSEGLQGVLPKHFTIISVSKTVSSLLPEAIFLKELAGCGMRTYFHLLRSKSLNHEQRWA